MLILGLGLRDLALAKNIKATAGLVGLQNSSNAM